MSTYIPTTNTTPTSNVPNSVDALTEREIEILRLIAEGLSNAEIAARLYLTVGTVKWYNNQIFAKLDVKNRAQAITRVMELGLLEDSPQPVVSPPRELTHNLPSRATPFVGREAEIAAITRLLSDPNNHLLTLVGPGGIGKTRLSIEAAEQLSARFPDGVYFVPLAPLATPEAIIPAVSNVIELMPRDGKCTIDQVHEHLRDRQVLLVLDNFEHLLSGAAVVTEILRAAPDVVILVTSRERLNLQEETVYRVGGMALPNTDSDDDALANGAVQLFLHAARRARPDFSPNADDLRAIARLCNLVEGMPLAILLAAAWIEMLSPAEIAVEITRSLDFLATEMRDLPERHRSIRGVFDSTWNHLTESERAAFARLSVFHGGFTREAAEQIAGAGLRTLMALVQKSLVTRADADGRYEIHELLRQYAADKLEASGQNSAIRGVHSQYFLNLLNSANRQRIDADFDNLHTAWTWAVDTADRASIERSAEALYDFCTRRSRYLDGANLFDYALKAGETQAFDALTLLRLREYRGRLRSLLGKFKEAIDDMTAVRNAIRTRGNHDWESSVVISLGQLYRKIENHVDAARVLKQVLSFAHEQHDPRAAAEALFHLGTVAWDEGDNHNAMRYHQEAVDLSRAQHSEGGLKALMQALHGYGESLYMSGQPRAALESFEESLALSRRLGDKSYEAENLEMIGWVWIGTTGMGDYNRALALFNEALVDSVEARLAWHEMCTLSGLGLAQASLGDYRQGLATIISAYQLADQMKVDRFAAMALDCLGQIFQDLNLYDRAEAVHAQGMQRMFRIESTFWLPRLKANFAIDRMRQGDLNVEGTLKLALEMATGRLQGFHATRALEGLAELYMLRGEPDKTLDYANQLLEIAEARELREMSAQAQRWRGAALTALHRYDEAADALSIATALAIQVGRVTLARDLHSAWAKLWQSRGDDDQAAVHESAAREMNAQIMRQRPDEALLRAVLQ